MSELLVAVLSGVSIYVLGQLVVRLFIEPYKNIFQAVEEAIFVAFTYDTVIASTWDIVNPQDHERLLEAKKEFREKGSRLVASISSFKAYSYLELFFNIPSKDDLMIAGQSLLEMGNLIGNAHGGNELTTLSQYKYLLANKLGVKLPSWEEIDLEKINEILRTL
jgi:hypothetical protein